MTRTTISAGCQSRSRGLAMTESWPLHGLAPRFISSISRGLSCISPSSVAPFGWPRPTRGHTFAEFPCTSLVDVDRFKQIFRNIEKR